MVCSFHDGVFPKRNRKIQKSPSASVLRCRWGKKTCLAVPSAGTFLAEEAHSHSAGAAVGADDRTNIVGVDLVQLRQLFRVRMISRKSMIYSFSVFAMIHTIPSESSNVKPPAGILRNTQWIFFIHPCKMEK